MNNCIMIAIGVILGAIMQTKGIIATTWQWWGIVGCLSIVYVIGYSMGVKKGGAE